VNGGATRPLRIGLGVHGGVARGVRGSVGHGIGGPGFQACVCQLLPGMFWLTENVNMGECAWWFDAGYPTMFDATCTHHSCSAPERDLLGPSSHSGSWAGPDPLPPHPVPSVLALTIPRAAGHW